MTAAFVAAARGAPGSALPSTDRRCCWPSWGWTRSCGSTEASDSALGLRLAGAVYPRSSPWRWGGWFESAARGADPRRAASLDRRGGLLGGLPGVRGVSVGGAGGAPRLNRRGAVTGRRSSKSSTEAGVPGEDAARGAAGDERLSALFSLVLLLYLAREAPRARTGRASPRGPPDRSQGVGESPAGAKAGPTSWRPCRSSPTARVSRLTFLPPFTA